MAELLAENEEMGRVLDADDRLKAALAEIYRLLKALTATFESRASPDRR